MIKLNIEAQLPDEDEDADDGMFGPDPSKMVAAMYAGKVSDPVPGQSYSGDMRQYSSLSSQGKHALHSVPEPGKWRAQDQNRIVIRFNGCFAERMTHRGATAKQRQDRFDRAIALQEQQSSRASSSKRSRYLAHRPKSDRYPKAK